MADNPTECKNLVKKIEPHGFNLKEKVVACRGPVVFLGRLLNNDYGDAGKLKHCRTCGDVTFVKEDD